MFDGIYKCMLLGNMSSGDRKRTQSVSQLARRKTRRLLDDVVQHSTDEDQDALTVEDTIPHEASQDLVLARALPSTSGSVPAIERDDVSSDPDDPAEYLSIWKAIDEAEGRVDSSSCDYDSTDEEGKPTFKDDLAQWAINRSVPLTTVTSLLSILRKRTDLDVPAQATTLLQTPRQIEVCKKSGVYESI